MFICVWIHMIMSTKTMNSARFRRELDIQACNICELPQQLADFDYSEVQHKNRLIMKVTSCKSPSFLWFKSHPNIYLSRICISFSIFSHLSSFFTRAHQILILINVNISLNFLRNFLIMLLFWNNLWDLSFKSNN